ncbi:hypothetical protein CLAFUW4_12474 [Fulvia fulva]|uniref:F-box domain-containing protein n=1 Tax=Passalora fulva TaxID=5499 RepID=A0A9Q8PEK7_PASFU|nr:uncharacterized protein CLAFUR5_11501 [Fulvia fulva]KAK4618023.1 hypothetical protein CLAFUR4_12479 [Fulvia fulva]KAK4619113.1 hypothetical protein CLAFUR0_12490 [Fulvia fulva]UJO20977.1 hypothetical protein CLAFUR5_11501 [Fulvia fulva]WPV18425.1 hypothetical protein CLAFUW4_12474 [Fulvia fulva]WPV33469.1 hypothetical protein CLAFUW7_12481 [Fulvia fulva]
MATASSKLTPLTLPRELRDLIYEFTFSEVIGLSFSRPDHNTPIRNNGGLVLTNRQIHNEAITKYYRHSIFYTIPEYTSLCGTQLCRQNTATRSEVSGSGRLSGRMRVPISGQGVW